MYSNEEIDARMARWVEAWRAAHARCAAIGDDKARAQAVKVADELFQKGIHDCLRPLFKAARKQKDPKVKKEKKAK
jgi:hypothetical protein